LRELTHLHSLWIGEKLGWLERLCLTSWVARGHEAILWAYNDVLGVPAGVKLRDAGEIIPMTELVCHRETGSPALFSDRFRYRLLTLGNLIWVDTDMLLLRPYRDDSEYVLAWEDDHLICGAFLRLPPSSAILRDLVALVESDVPVLPWWSARRRMKQRVRGLIGWHKRACDMPWGSFGPIALTEFVRRHRLGAYVQDPTAFYPVHYQEAGMFFGPSSAVDDRIKPETIAVHLWSSSAEVSGRKARFPDADSWIGSACRRLGIEPGVR
jgi:hypothetical protein